jgi:hypothetical protein
MVKPRVRRMHRTRGGGGRGLEHCGKGCKRTSRYRSVQRLTYNAVSVPTLFLTLLAARSDDVERNRDVDDYSSRNVEKR